MWLGSYRLHAAACKASACLCPFRESIGHRHPVAMSMWPLAEYVLCEGPSDIACAGPAGNTLGAAAYDSAMRICDATGCSSPHQKINQSYIQPAYRRDPEELHSSSGRNYWYLGEAFTHETTNQTARGPPQGDYRKANEALPDTSQGAKHREGFGSSGRDQTRYRTSASHFSRHALGCILTA